MTIEAAKIENNSSIVLCVMCNRIWKREFIVKCTFLPDGVLNFRIVTRMYDAGITYVLFTCHEL